MIHATRTIDVFASPEQTTATKALVFTGGPRDGELINDGRSRMTAGDCLSRNAAEATAPEVAAFAKALAAVEGVPQSMPLHVRQMGVYYGWYDFDEITPQGQGRDRNRGARGRFRRRGKAQCPAHRCAGP
jgi:hypothetical protein